MILKLRIKLTNKDGKWKYAKKVVKALKLEHSKLKPRCGLLKKFQKWKFKNSTKKQKFSEVEFYFKNFLKVEVSPPWIFPIKNQPTSFNIFFDHYQGDF